MNILRLWEPCSNKLILNLVVILKGDNVNTLTLFGFLGSPLVVSLIGALLRDFPNRWEYYLRQLQNKQFKRIRKSSSYDYEALDEAMSISVDMLREEIKDYYTDLSIFQKDVKVPTKVIGGPTILFPGYLWRVTFNRVPRILLRRIRER